MTPEEKSSYDQVCESAAESRRLCELVKAALHRKASTPPTPVPSWDTLSEEVPVSTDETLITLQ